MTVEAPSDVWVRSTCSMCFNSCGIKVHLINDVVVKIEDDGGGRKNQSYGNGSPGSNRNRRLFWSLGKRNAGCQR